MKNPMTTAQIGFVRNLLAECEFDPKTCTLFHTQIAEEARLDSPRPKPGDTVDQWLSTVTKQGAQRLIAVLKERCS